VKVWRGWEADCCGGAGKRNGASVMVVRSYRWQLRHHAFFNGVRARLRRNLPGRVGRNVLPVRSLPSAHERTGKLPQRQCLPLLTLLCLLAPPYLPFARGCMSDVVAGRQAGRRWRVRFGTRQWRRGRSLFGAGRGRVPMHPVVAKGTRLGVDGLWRGSLSRRGPHTAQGKSQARTHGRPTTQVAAFFTGRISISTCQGLG